MVRYEDVRSRYSSILKKMDIDPAIGSTVILTTVTDVVDFLSFLGLSTSILL